MLFASIVFKFHFICMKNSFTVIILQNKIYYLNMTYVVLIIVSDSDKHERKQNLTGTVQKHFTRKNVPYLS
jgi:hypothetical protein